MVLRNLSSTRFRFGFFAGIFGVMVSCFPIGVYAANDRTVSVADGPFSLSGMWGGVLGSLARIQDVSATYRMGTAEGSLSIVPGGTLSFSSNHDDSEAVFRGGIFGGETLIGSWEGSIDSRSDCTASPMNFLVGVNQFSFVLCGRGSSIALSSSNASVVSCSGLACSGNAVGTARITATLSGSPVRVWGQRDSEGWMELVSETLPGATLSWDVTVSRPPVLNFSASEGTSPLDPLPYDTDTMLTWSAQYADDCVASGDWNGSRGASGGPWSTGNLQARRDYTLTCTGSGGTVRQTVSVFVGSVSSGPVISLFADANPVSYGTSTTIRWSVTGALSCDASGDWQGPGPGPRGTTGSQSTGNLTSQKVYLLSCTGSTGSSAVSLTVFVGATFDPPSFSSFTATPTSVLYDAGTRLSWNVRSANNCVASSLPARPDWQGNKAVSSSQNVTNLRTDTEFTLVCSGSGGDATGHLVVPVAPQSLPNPTISAFFTDDADLFVPYDSPVTFFWTASNVSWCEGVGGWFPRTTTSFNGSHAIGSLTASRNFTFRCGNSFGQTVEQTIPITVGLPSGSLDIVSFIADTSLHSGIYYVPYNSATTLRWEVENAVACEMNQNGVISDWGTLYGFSGSRSTGRLVSNQRYILTCRGVSGTLSETVYIEIGSGGTGTPPPSLSFVTDSTYIAYNTGTMLTWLALNVTSCTASSSPALPAWSGVKPFSGTFFTGNLRGRTVFSLDCTSPLGTIRRSVTVLVGDPLVLPPTITFRADGYSVSSGESTVLRWTTTGATSCVPFGDWSGSIGTSGSRAIGPLTASSSYRIRCSNAGGSVFQSLSVMVGVPVSPPSIALWTDTAVVASGGDTVLRWNVQNATSCSASSLPITGIWQGGVALSGAKNTGPLLASQQYILECSGPGGTTEARTGVGVGVSAFGPVISVFGADSAIIESGSTPNLYLASENTAECCIAQGSFNTWDTCAASGRLLGATSGVFQVGSPVSGSTEYWAVCRNTLGLAASRQLFVNVGQLLVCPASTLIAPSRTESFSAWYVPGGGATCSSDFAALGAENVTTSSDPETRWSSEVGTGEVTVSSQGIVTGVRPGSARVLARFKPRNSSAEFSAAVDVVVGTPISCYRCESDSRCSTVSEVSFDDPPVCSAGLFQNEFRCKLDCFKDRWQEVAP